MVGWGVKGTQDDTQIGYEYAQFGHSVNRPAPATISYSRPMILVLMY